MKWPDGRCFRPEDLSSAMVCSTTSVPAVVGLDLDQRGICAFDRPLTIEPQRRIRA